MTEEAIFVAIGIACVVAVLLFIVFIIYCVKKQQDKAQDRHIRQRRAREQRHRRQLMRAHIVRPPPYDPNRQNMIPSQDVIPVSPPPEYKERATPMASRTNRIDHGDTAYNLSNGFRSHTGDNDTINENTVQIATLSADNNYVNNSYSNRNSHNIRINNNNNHSYINRNTITTTRSGHVRSNISQMPRQNVASDNRDLVSRSSSVDSANTDHSYEINRQIPSVNERQRNLHTAPQELSAAALIRQQHANKNVPVNTISSVKPGETRIYNSYSRNAGNSFSNSPNYHKYNGLLGAGRNSSQADRKTVNEMQTGRINSSRYTLSGSEQAVQTPRHIYDVDIVTVTPVQIASRGLQTRDGATRQTGGHVGKSERTSGLEELSLI